MSAIQSYFTRILDWISKNKKTSGRIIAIVLILLLAVCMRIFGNTSPKETEEPEAATTAYVDISGEVISPGIYEVDDETRLFELIELAGGLKENADIDSINQAEFVTDGQKIIIPSLLPDEDNNPPSEQNTVSGTQNSRININTASREELKQLSGIGDVIADRIIEYRSSNRFMKIEEIKNVKGIGDSIFEKIKGQITI